MSDQTAFRSHDHDTCIAEAMEAARALSAERRLRLTPTRARVLEILLESHRALGAYEVLERLSAEGLGSQPPVAYRALEFLTKHGFAHRVEKLNAFVACCHPRRSHDPAFLICTGCGKVAEEATEPSAGRLGAAAETLGFDIHSAVIEAEGLCPVCRVDAS